MALILAKRGDRKVTCEQLAHIRTPDETTTHKPIPHVSLLFMLEGLLGAGGYRIHSEQLAVNRAGSRFFGVLTLETDVVPGQVKLVIGVRSSWDKSVAYGLAGGTRTVCCSNLVLSGDIIAHVRRKHTLHGRSAFAAATTAALRLLPGYREREANRIAAFRGTDVADRDAGHLILTAYRERIVPLRYLGAVWDRWQEPRHDFGGKTAYRLLQAFTSALSRQSERNIRAYAAETTRLVEHLGRFVGYDSPELAPQTPEA